MAPVLDGFACLRGIGAHRDAFPDLPADEVARAAIKLVVQQMKASAGKVGAFRRISEAIGRDRLEAIIGNIGERDLNALLTGIDKGYKTTTDLASKRAQLLALAAGIAESAPDYKAAKRKLTGKEVSLGTVRDLYLSSGKEQFTAVLKGLSDTQTRTLVRKLDRINPRLATASASWLKGRVMALAAGMAEPEQAEAAEDGTGSPWSEAIDVALKRRK